ncbi:hypothetical protein K493DRAFT_295037 [Basidiobolus meristosporus CBS 931.73]|uniref:Uncharacterized protein n=1 Tax=Basidiobolus meristosporus CBS 931.73 TaxID=1314790 RepID=A0A1Y1ZD77_9FUNG|nr:hypothetical protein K493DRAFT_295037 [Basidiobolus meristosporus CBS 931.73]|eukprot:ORY08242.1 hypothetical protein K493DRAFT_295037 [Basidiobolus meristosporus CBS 931.73]
MTRMLSEDSTLPYHRYIPYFIQMNSHESLFKSNNGSAYEDTKYELYHLHPIKSWVQLTKIFHSSPNVTISVRDLTRAKVIHLKIPQGTLIRKAVELCCDHFEYWDEWNYAIWLNDAYSIESYPPEARKSLMLLSKKPDYFELMASKLPILSRNSDEATKLPPKHSSFSNFFGRSYTSLKTKLRRDCLFLSVMVFRSDHKILQTSNGLLPTVLVTESFSSVKGDKDFNEQSDDFVWILKAAMDWENTNTSYTYNPLVHNQARHQGYNVDLRLAFCDAACNLMKITPLPKLGLLYEHPLDLLQLASKMLLSFQYVSDDSLPSIAAESIKNGTLKWRTVECLDTEVYASCCTVFSQAWSLFNARYTRPSPGLYISLLHLQATPSGLNILIPKDRKHTMPMIKIRDDPTLTKSEWNTVLATREENVETNSIEDIQYSLKNSKNLSDAAQFRLHFLRGFIKLQQITRLDLSLADLYDVETVELKLPREPQIPNSPTISKRAPFFPETARIIFIVKPLRLLENNNILESYAHHPRLTMYSFKHFEALHHHMYNLNYEPYRRSMLTYLNHLNDAKKGILTSIQQLKLNDGQAGVMTKDRVVTVLKQKIQELKDTWHSISWSVRVLEWDRNRHWEQRIGKHYQHNIGGGHLKQANLEHKQEVLHSSPLTEKSQYVSR